MENPKHNRKFILQYGDQTRIANSVNCSTRCVRKVIKGDFKQKTQLQSNIITLAIFLESFDNRNDEFSKEFESFLDTLELNTTNAA